MPADVLRPNIAKLFIISLLKFAGTALGIIIVIIVLHLFVGMEVFAESFGAIGVALPELGIDVGVLPSAGAVITLLAGVAIVIFAAMGVYHYVLLTNLRYEFEDEQMKVYQTVAFLVLREQAIPYRNISRVSIAEDGVLAPILSSGSLTLELSAMKQQQVRLRGLDNPQQLA